MSLQTIISSSPLSDADKKALLNRLQAEGATPDVVGSIKEALQEYIDAGFKTLGVEADPNNPSVISAQQHFDEEVASAEAEYNEDVENATIDAAVAQAQTNKAIEALEADTIKAKIAA
ncbi:MAG: hypothetical protein AAB473_03495 [Patescibacteria group bacterium]